MSMSRATRQIVVAHLASIDMPQQQIADELGVSRETVRRDLNSAPPPATSDAPAEEAPDVAPPVLFGPQGLSLPASLQLGQDLRLLAASYKAPAEDVARQLLHEQAEAIRDRMRARSFGTERT
ncbi:helix-turn-helix domain-containing protein [Streptomyces chartreusis]|uniref:helix-turn-helix domain-containing protein n=1 Tax=Streptomyces chartreusis TaxID=1969 RepID=UPI00381EE2EB